MHKGKFVFSQLLDFLDRKISTIYQGNTEATGMSGSFLVTTSFAC